MLELPEVGYTLATASKLIGCHPKSIYRIVQRGDLTAFVDASGRMMVSREELYSYIKRKESESKD
jgi:predicted site-specific integrase-resolvase